MKAVKEKGKSGTDWGGFPANLADDGHIYGGCPSPHFCQPVYVEMYPIKETATFYESKDLHIFPIAHNGGLSESVNIGSNVGSIT